MYDLLIKNGAVIDGTGSAPCMVDIAVQGGNIVALGQLAAEAHTVIDASGVAMRR
jgi:N-acyl-D-amino-acid deacylase